MRFDAWLVFFFPELGRAGSLSISRRLQKSGTALPYPQMGQHSPLLWSPL
jgi:hypothetical protein